MSAFPVIGTTGFYKAPISKCLLLLSPVASFALAFPLQHYQHLFIYNPQTIFDNSQVWRVFTSKLVFLDAKDLIICCMLFYYFRIFERRYGSRKFASHLLVSGILATLLEMLAVFACHSLKIDVDFLTTGPFYLVYPLFVPYYFDIPRVAMTTIMGVPVTGKTLTYILGLQIASGSFESRLVAACGIMAGLLMRVNFLKLRSIIFIPNVVAKLFSSTLGRLLESSPPKSPQLPMGATLELQRQEQLDRLEQQMVWTFQNNQQQNRNHIEIGRPQPLNLAQGPGIFGNEDFRPGLRQRLNPGNAEVEENHQNISGPVSEEQVQRLVEMGFNQERVRQALQVSNNDISMATTVLLQET
ncbi:ubiquitin-associated domain-containing protein 2-like [Gigantopelta aegis]|uniref:ubiquitin-associated domain-containing protein 2-like n=1 Tax=Gigantopelta aegis TaxID=1735272 RepID=UPI001B88E5C4|nr:ubiquitin-associated domain-containing protein 2-like [Gigantopelta aegis]